LACLSSVRLPDSSKGCAKLHLRIVAGLTYSGLFARARLNTLKSPPHLRCYHYGVTNSARKVLPRDLRAVFLDRDGVLNEKMPEGRYVTSWKDFHILPGVPEALAKLNRAGLRVVVASNQRGIALGLFTAADLETIHSTFQSLLNIQGAHVDAFFYCPHDRGQCNCRKPLPGLFKQAATEFPEISAAASVMIGDSLVDIEFGHSLGMTTILIEDNLEKQRPGAEAARELADLRFPTLIEAVNALLDRRQ
jgi:D-glycero-D-manno-heptose 1,7-bisphosphate phosphatase